MNIKNRFISGIILSLVCGLIAAGPAYAAQDKDADEKRERESKDQASPGRQ